MTASGIGESYKAALLVVDVQEDFCPPVGVPTVRKIEGYQRELIT